ncbi:MAG: hypothetical protein A3K19_09640 [Lentisphaerae bacterium RIFOXYB12_FULL_65_16]|nr:MAG: hypothetical protein A3K18_03660 [Lentisphaerae bacterium RIFOXYA12_64_32]OGV90512.1 MAG: hypothetical protein A3K19_09640 [Lentisphaerae bacterium RIFOXYB12_FULL_65_16]
MGGTKKTKPSGAPAKPPKTRRTRPAPAVDSLARSQTPPEANFPVVGIGASAGGLAACRAFFSAIPANADTGLAFVLVQHLSPDHNSTLSELLRHYTHMLVFEVEDGVRVAPNCIYVIPPGHDMALQDGALRLLPPSGPRGLWLPIDFFFQSLAQDRRERGVCIVLSGTGSDGTQGLRAIKGEGGMVMAQTPESAEFDGMPRSAIATGLVDYVLPPAEMPARLVAYTNYAPGKRLHHPTAPAPEPSDVLRQVCVLLRAHTGHDLSQFKANTLSRRVERRMAMHQIARPDEYLQYLRITASEVEALFRDLLIGVTRFFRDTEAFAVLQAQVVPRLFTGKTAGAAVRVWVCGCSTGEEAYSIAIVLHEYMATQKQAFKVQVFASDIDKRAIEQARAGVFPASIATDISPERLARFFVHDPASGGFRVQKAIRDLLVFSEQDVIRDPPFSRLDLISCRNLLIYFNENLHHRLIPLFHGALKPDGVLFLGTSETVGEFSTLFATLDRTSRLYACKRDVVRAPRAAPGATVPFLRGDDHRARLRREEDRDQAKVNFHELTELTMLQHYAHAGVLVDGRGNILHVRGRTGRFLEPAPGDAGMNILTMAREGLRRELTIALRKVASQKQPVRYPGLRVKTDSEFIVVDLTVRPVAAGADGTAVSDLVLVIIEETPWADAGRPAQAVPMDARALPDSDGRISALEQELQAKEEYLQTMVEEMVNANEELTSTNDRMQSVNEDLQSTNEELETATEEMQSVNEELATVNAELQVKVCDLSQANNDMNNLLAGTGVGTLFVDLQLRITRFTPAVTQVINLVPTDIGRPLGHFAANLTGYSRLVDDVRTVLDDLAPREVEVRTDADVWYLMRIRPYRTVEHAVGGAVLTFVDITEHRRVKAITEARLRLVDLAPRHSMGELLQVMLDELCTMTDSPIGFFHFVEPDQRTLSLQAWSTRTLQEMCTAEGAGHKYDIAQAGVWVDCLRERQPVIHNDYAALPHRKGLPPGHAPLVREMVVPVFRGESIVAIIGVGNKLREYDQGDLATATRLADLMWDITERKRAEEALRERDQLLQRSQAIAHLGSWELDLLKDRLFWSDEVYRIFGLQPQEFSATYEAFIEAIHPDDRAAVDAAYSSSLREGRDTYEIEHRVVRKTTGEVRIVHEKCTHVRDAAGRIVRSIGMVHDITEQKQVAVALQRSAQFPEQNPDPVLRVGGDGVVLYANGPARAWLTSLGGATDRPLPAAVGALVAEARASGQVVEADIPDAGGRTFWFSAVQPPGEDYVNLYGHDATGRVFRGPAGHESKTGSKEVS